MTPAAEAGLAGLPILTILVLMLGLRWSAARAGAIGMESIGQCVIEIAR